MCNGYSEVVSEFEEVLRSGTLRPTIAEWLGRKDAVTSVLLIFGALLYFVVPDFQAVGIGIMVLAAINFFNSYFAAKFENSLVRRVVSIGIVGTIS